MNQHSLHHFNIKINEQDINLRKNRAEFVARPRCFFGAFGVFRVCKLLSDQGIDVVVCSIAMYESVRQWNRENIENYKEIYIKVSKDTLLQRNQSVTPKATSLFRL